MKKALSILLLVAIIGQTLVNVGIGMYYHINKEYISQKLCENRNNPAMHCNGHCFLTKQLKKAEDREQKSSNILKEKEEIISVAPAFSPIQVSVHTNGIQLFFGHASKISSRNHIFGIIKPPELA